MYLSKKRHIVIITDFVLLALSLILHFNSLFSLKIYGAIPMLPLAFLVAISIFSSELYSFMSALLVGIFVDSISSVSFGFNTCIFMVIALFVALTSHYLFNNNVRAALALAAMSSFIYFVLRWFFFDAITHSVRDSFTYLYKVAMPSALYTAIISVLVYLLKKSINKKFNL